MSNALSLQPSGLWHRHWREIVASSALGVAAILAAAGVSGATPLSEFFAFDSDVHAAPASVPAPPAPLSMDVEQLSAEQAAAANANIPIKGDAQAAAPFVFGKASVSDRGRALDCLTQAVYYEAATEPEDGQRAVAQVILNRVRHPAFPNSVCGVVYEGSTRPTGCQFTFTCDGSMTRTPVAALWKRSHKIAEQALAGLVYAPVGHSTHYHANYVLPYWASSQVKTSVIGAHIFYRWPGNWGLPAAFVQRWSGHEANPVALRLAALNAPHVAPTITTPATATLAQLEAKGVEVKDLGGRVQLRFAPQAREAVEKATTSPKAYVESVEASDNLRYALDGAAPASEQPALGNKSAE
nr:cell wall hydrolase [uncultured Sphingomonas sp.]